MHFVGFEHFGVHGPVAHVVGVDDQVQAAASGFGFQVGDLHADFQEFALIGVEAGGFGVYHDVVKQWRLQRRDASWIVASVFVPVAHWVFLCSLRLCGHIQYSRQIDVRQEPSDRDRRQTT